MKTQKRWDYSGREPILARLTGFVWVKMMARKWIKTQYPGVRYYEHKDRRHNNKPDRYFSIRYKKKGKSVEEAAGWASNKMNAQTASFIRGEIVQNIREGKRPQSLAEKRQMEDDLKAAEEFKQQQLEKENVKFSEIAENYLEWAESNKKDHANDKSRYDNHIEPVIGNIRVKDVSPLILEKLKREIYNKDLSDKTVHHCLALIRTIYRKAIIWGQYQGDIPTKSVKWPKLDNKRVRFLSHAEAKLLLDKVKAVSEVVYNQSTISLHCGLRFSEIANLRWSDVDLSNKILQILDPKNESRPVYLTSETEKIFSDLNKKNKYKPNDLLFPDKHEKPQKHVSNTYYRMVKDIGFNDGITDRRQKVCFHTLRHSFASWLAIQGTSLYEIMELMGHKDIKMTQRYAHLSPNIKRESVNKLADGFKASIEMDNNTKNQAKGDP